MKQLKLLILLLLSLLSVSGHSKKGCLVDGEKGVWLRVKVVQVSVTYDSLGNMILKTKRRGEDLRWQGGDWGYEWLSNGMLGSVQRPDGERVVFSYDALGRRLSKTFKKTTTNWLWDGNKPLHQWKSFESKDVLTDDTITWIFNEYDYSPLAKIKNDKVYTIINDYLGTPNIMFDDQGEEVWYGSMDIHGRKKQEIGTQACPFRYQGQYEDYETGLYYNRFRYYSPEESQYLSEDPIGLEGGNPTLYGYVNNNNIEYDPFGLSCHGNSKKSKKSQHGYVIYNKKTGEILEYGISGQKLNKNGTSPRIAQKLRTKYNNNPDIEGKVLKPNIKGTSGSSNKTARENALNWEQGKVNSYSKANQANGNSSGPIGPPNQEKPGPQM